ncbi:uncharacterized protein LOC130800575 isoform X1 [Amaranthus tricolor]|uniref:uncharacterized protein LOC130800575 isoform X1 n=1 Tax=Amaranthus tricolor TaxID=29722 RepID=UPI00258CF4EB|nr:uncharacterized protein LOC130800575 isoform X1 [Amaranthus tricolor]
MYGGSLKFGRGGGPRGGTTAGKRNSFPPPPLQRPSSSSGGRNSLSLRKPSSATPPPPPPETSDESFSLVSGDPLSFAAIIRLAPDLIDEIKRLESQGGAARIKFDSNPTNPSANVIDVGGKEFRFTWAHEMGGLCDIYEERQSGEDGNGLLVESGSAWRKLNVQRVLDESTKKQVKKRSEEYEQKQKSRKAIVLDQCNHSMKSQMQALAAAEASPWKFKTKNKRFFDPSQVGSQPKHVKSTTGFSATVNAKGKHSTSPLPSLQNQSVSLGSSSVRGNDMESQTVVKYPTTNQARAKENTVRSENDLRNSLITLLKENPKGMNLKALEKAVGDMTSNSARKLEPILKKIATYEPPGRYILKSAVELEKVKRSNSDSGSSPEDHNHKQFSLENNNHDEAQAPDLEYNGKPLVENLEEQVSKIDEESNMVEKYDASKHFPELFGDDEAPEHSGGRATRSIDSSDTDTDSGSSDNDSDSPSQSRSRSPARSGSASSSDSDGDDSSANSKETSDVDVDIMSDGDKELTNLQESGHGLSTASVPWSMPESLAQQAGRTGDQDGYVSEDVDIDIIDDNEAQLVAPHNVITTEKLRPVSPDHDRNQPCNGTDDNEQVDVEDEFQHERCSSVKSRSKSKRGSESIQFEHDADHVKRFKPNASQSGLSRHTASHTLGSPGHIGNEENRESHNVQMSNQLNRDDGLNGNLHSQRAYDFVVPGKSAAESLKSSRRLAAHPYKTETSDKVVKNPSNMGVDPKLLETNAYTQEGPLKQEDKGYREAQDEEDSSNKKANGKFEESPLIQKPSSRLESHYRKHSERDRKSHSLGNFSQDRKYSLKDSGKADFDRSPADKRSLQREQSDLELGELRETFSEEPDGAKRQFERVGSFKKSETKVGFSGFRSTESKGKPVSTSIVDPGNTSSPNARVASNNLDGSLRRRSPVSYAEDNSHLHGAMQSQQSRNGHAEVESLPKKVVDRSRLGNTEAVANQGTDAEGCGETQKKSHISSQREDFRQEFGSHKGKGSKPRKYNTSKEANENRRKDVSNIRGRKEKRKRSESSDDNTSYSKYEKEEPELKAPIKSFSQYEEYVQEYREKYESYCSVNKILERDRNEFQKLGMALDSAKGRDTEKYKEIVAQLRASYKRCGARHKRLKKIFLVLHEELKHLKQMILDFAADYMRD